MRVLVVDIDLVRGLRTLRALAEQFDVTAADRGEDPVRAARRVGAECVVVGATGRPPDVLALVRALRTDTRPPRFVVLHGRGGPARTAAVAPGLADYAANHDLGGKEVIAVLAALASGHAPPPPRPGGALRALFRRFAGA
jgi:DNA-binding response OmpR family regulator